MLPRSSRRLFHFTATLTLVAAFLPGCRRPAYAPNLPELTSASEVLERMVAAYHEARSYQDSAQVRLHFKKRGEGKENAVDREWDYSIAFERPNKLRMHVYQSVVVCDGTKLFAAIHADDVRNQVLSVSAPEKLSPQGLFEADPRLTQVLTQGGAAGPPLLLPLLLEEAPLDPVLEGAEKPALLPPEDIDGQSCYRVEVKRPDGRLAFWIDRKNFALRRIEYPTEEFRKGVEQTEGPVTELAVTVEFTGATLNAAVEPAAFQFELPQGSRLVEQFMVPPPLLGQRIGDFQFRDLDGHEVTRETLAGKVAVIDFWATWCEPCLKSLPHLEQVANRYRGNDKIVFLAVSVDNADVGDDAVREKFTESKLSLPIARDPNIAAREVFLVESLPTLVLLSPDGVVQDYENVFDPELANSLPPKLDKLLVGENIFEDTLRQYGEPSAVMPQTDVQAAVAAIAERSEPRELSMSSVWTSKELTSPGNVLAIDGESGRVLVLDNWQAVAELDAKGAVIAHHKLDLPKQPEEAVVSFLRTAVDAQGRRFYLGSANSVQQLFVFDAQWKRVLTFPEGGTHPGITDAQLADLDGDGTPELIVGFWGPEGVRAVSLDGQTRWTNAKCENVLRLALLRGGQDGAATLLTTTALGNIVPLDQRGQEGKPWAAAKRFAQLVFAADLNDDGVSEVCALGPSGTAGEAQQGENAVFGLNANGDVLWEYRLPAGVPANGALEYVTSGKLVADEGQWVIAGPNGSIHILSLSGELIDRFNSGVSLGGIAVAQLDDQRALILASPEGVEARVFSR